MNNDDATWYVSFISIVFGVFISVWATQTAIVLNLAFTCEGQCDPTLTILVRGGFLFAILICLWWWYAKFFFAVAPPKTFLMYFYDFLSLGIFAIAFSTWRTEVCYNFAVTTGAVAVALRLVFAYRSKSMNTHKRIVLFIPFISLTPYILYVVFLIFFSRYITVTSPTFQYLSDPNNWHLAVTLFLAVSFIATLGAAIAFERFSDSSADLVGKLKGLT